MRLPATGTASTNRWAKDLQRPPATMEHTGATAMFDINGSSEFDNMKRNDLGKNVENVSGENEDDVHGYTSDSGAGTVDAGKSFWLKLLENRDENSSNGEYDDDNDEEDESREEIEDLSRTNTPRVQEISQQAPSTYPKKTVVQKWENIIRANHHGLENFGKRIEFDDNLESSSRSYTRRSVGILTSHSNTSKPTKVRKSFGLGDITNSLNTPLSTSSTPKDVRIESSDTNQLSSRTHSRISVSDGVTSHSNLSKPTKARRSFGLGDFTSLSTSTTSKDATNHSNTSKPTKARRSFDLGDFTNNLNVPLSTGTNPRGGNVSSKFSLHDNNMKGKEDHSVTKSTVAASWQAERTSNNTTNNSGNSDDYESTAKDVDSIASVDSDKTGFKKLLGIWNHQSDADHNRSFRSPPNNSKKLSKDSTTKNDVDVTESFTKKSDESFTFTNIRMNQTFYGREDAASILASENCSVSTKDVIPSSFLPLKQRSISDYVVSNNGLIYSDEYEESNKLSADKEPIRALVILEQRNTCDILIGEARQNNEGEERLVIQNIDFKTEGIECECSRSAFSGNDDLISFFLPQMGMACACGRKRDGLINPNDPTALENILRPWQVEFLKSFGIHRGEQLVKARHRSAGIMARALRQWRKKHGMISFKTSSCGTALQLWSKICKAYVRSIRKQILAGNNENFERETGAALFGEMSQFLDDLPAAPKRRDRTSDDFLDIEPESQVEV